MARRMLVAGNWKMHGVRSDLGEITAISMAAETENGTDVAVCVPFTLIERAVAAAPGFVIGAQDVHASAKGAHTGDISAAMLADVGAEIVIVGHSERRAAHHETNADTAAKADAALAGGLDVIVCCGESLEVREAGKAVATVCDQIIASLPGTVDPARMAIAYEPIWAIGTGKVAQPSDVAEMHAAIRARLAKEHGDETAANMRILYGGSVKGENAAELFAMEDVDGALVGGASLTAAQFVPIIDAAKN
ncbi:triose-phosphate isomerase [Sphingomicrobium marinum]|uniref:triose-phosphate isomerase n=1 Tax=Sphingomicrobium marinum TaxID=1227950 RepID=UPI002240AB69|nr:triose-phosphate isomerase [Sphingomicrobium marinum]